jgi:hypothetical protein
MRVVHLIAALAIAGLFTVPGLASAHSDDCCCYEYDYYADDCCYYPYAVAGSRTLSRSSTAYADGFDPWAEGGTWATVNGQHIWVTPSDFVWNDNRWVWRESPGAMLVFDDPRYQVRASEWYAPNMWTPWDRGGALVVVDGERVWATPDNFTWSDNRWVWTADPSARIRFYDDRFDVNNPDWGVSIDRDRLDLDMDRLEVDPDRFNIDEDRLKIETDID